MKLTRNKVLIAALGVMLVGAIALSQTVGRADRMHGHGFPFRGHMLGFFADYLDLTDAQQAQMKQILEKEKPTIQPLLEQLGQGHQQLRQLEESGTFDESKVRALAAQNSQAMTELIVQKARIQSELIQVLTPDQKAKFTKFMDRRAERFHKWMNDSAQPPQS
jgi:Spy/CpxP family protein refolding chaperone